LSFYLSTFKNMHIIASDCKVQNGHYENTIIKRVADQKRFFKKDGTINVHFKHVFSEWESYVVDIFTTLVDLKWRHMFVIFSLSYILSWLLFGFLFWIIALGHGDLVETENTPCVDNVNSFIGAFLFSLETQTTIGYGSRCVTEECSLAIIMVTLQSVLSCVIDTLIIGAAIAKMATARKRAQTIGFSYYAVIGMRNGSFCLMWRIGDFRQNHIVEGTVKAQFIRYKRHDDRKVTMEYKDLQLVNNQITLITPVTIAHEIDKTSPFYNISKWDLIKETFEVLVTFTYTGDSTGICHQSRSSYTPQEILWGYRFNEVVMVKKHYYKVDYLEFDNTTEVYAPLCSAKQLETKWQSFSKNDLEPNRD
uniref:Inward rectifier potassium channel 16 n=1 Tax=Latimeria chalumnae TaxID=7897 RepID=H3B180_LATCH